MNRRGGTRYRPASLQLCNSTLLQLWLVAYWHVGAPSFSPVIGGVALPTKIPQVVVVAVLDDVPLQPVPLDDVIVIVFPTDTL